MDIAQLGKKIENGDYDNHLVFPHRGNTKKNDLVPKAKAWREESRRIKGVFKHDALTAVGLSKHPKADKIFDYAWERGHSSGYSEVLTHLIDLVDLFN